MQVRVQQTCLYLLELLYNCFLLLNIPRKFTNIHLPTLNLIIRLDQFQHNLIIPFLPLGLLVLQLAPDPTHLPLKPRKPPAHQLLLLPIDHAPSHPNDSLPPIPLNIPHPLQHPPQLVLRLAQHLPEVQLMLLCLFQLFLQLPDNSLESEDGLIGQPCLQVHDFDFALVDLVKQPVLLQQMGVEFVDGWGMGKSVYREMDFQQLLAGADMQIVQRFQQVVYLTDGFIVQAYNTRHLLAIHHYFDTNLWNHFTLTIQINCILNILKKMNSFFQILLKSIANPNSMFLFLPTAQKHPRPEPQKPLQIIKPDIKQIQRKQEVNPVPPPNLDRPGRTNLHIMCPIHSSQQEHLMHICLETTCREQPLLCILCKQSYHDKHQTSAIGKFASEVQNLIYNLSINDEAQNYKNQLKAMKTEFLNKTNQAKKEINNLIEQNQKRFSQLCDLGEAKIEQSVNIYHSITIKPFQINTQLQLNQVFEDVIQQKKDYFFKKENCKLLPTNIKAIVQSTTRQSQTISESLPSLIGTILKKFNLQEKVRYQFSPFAMMFDTPHIPRRRRKEESQQDPI